MKRAMEGVEGVRSVEIDFDAGTATLIFDPSVTDAGTIGAASANAGCPAIAQSCRPGTCPVRAGSRGPPFPVVPGTPSRGTACLCAAMRMGPVAAP